MNDTILPGDAPRPDAPHHEAPMQEPEAEPEAPALKAWVMAYSHIGLMNIVAESQAALVAQVTDMRRQAAHETSLYGTANLQAIEVVRGQDVDGPTTIWINPLLIEAVLDQAVPAEPVLPIPPGLAEALKRADLAHAVAEQSAAIEAVVEVMDPAAGSTKEEPSGE